MNMRMISALTIVKNKNCPINIPCKLCCLHGYACTPFSAYYNRNIEIARQYINSYIEHYPYTPIEELLEILI